MAALAAWVIIATSVNLENTEDYVILIAPTLGELHASPFQREAHHWYRDLHVHFRCRLLDALWICHCIHRVSIFTRIQGACNTSHIERLSHIAHDYRMRCDDKDSAVPAILAANTALLVCFAFVLSYEAIHSAPKSGITSSNWYFSVLMQSGPQNGPSTKQNSCFIWFSSTD